MPIRFYCHQCQARIKVPDGAQGKKVKCPRCGATQRIPDQSEPQRGDDAAEVATAAAATPAPGAASAAAAHAKTESEPVKVEIASTIKAPAESAATALSVAASQEMAGPDGDTVDAEHDDPLAALAAAAESRTVSTPAPPPPPPPGARAGAGAGAAVGQAVPIMTRTTEPPTPIKPVITSFPRPQPQAAIKPPPQTMVPSMAATAGPGALESSTAAPAASAAPATENVSATTSIPAASGSTASAPAPAAAPPLAAEALAAAVTQAGDSHAPASVFVTPAVPSPVVPPHAEPAAGSSGIRPIKAPEAPRPIPLSAHPNTARPLAKPMPLSEHVPAPARPSTLGPVPHYPGLLLASWLLRGGAALLLAIVLFTLLFTLIHDREALPAKVLMLVAGLLAGVFLFAVAEALTALRDIARNSFRR